MKEVCKTFGVDSDLIFNDSKPPSQESVIFKDDKLAFDKGSFKPDKLILIGYLYCAYSDAKTHI
jgi:hypothetical protein